MALPTLKRPATLPTGPRLYQLNKTPEHLGPPGPPPEGFVTPKTSATEWPVYWGLARITGYPEAKYVRSSPFIGGPPVWTYQAFAEAGNDKQSNIDFVVWNPQPGGTPVAIRVQTEFFHNFASIQTQLYDIIQRDRLENGFEVVDLYDFDYMRDKSGSAVIVLLKGAMGLIERPSAIRSGRVQRV
jgi:hypothetical protein